MKVRIMKKIKEMKKIITKMKTKKKAKKKKKKKKKEKKEVKDNKKENELTPIGKEEKNITPLNNKNTKLTPECNKQNIKNEFLGDPQKLKFKEYLTNINSSKGWICNIEVYISIKDNIEYLVYDNYYNYNLDIMRIEDKTIITSLKGHNYYTSVIRYYLKDNNEEYVLSCDEYNIVIIWDIGDYYKKKYKIQEKGYSGYIKDALLLFNIFNMNYILLSSNANEYSQLYEFNKKTKYIKKINGTNKYYTFYMIPWEYNNKYFIIECGNKIISINNLLENENYAELSMEPEYNHGCGFIYKDNYLCVSDNYNGFIRVWDLIKKVIYKQINYNIYRGYEIIAWNNTYSILGTTGSFVIFDIEEGKVVKKINSDNNYNLKGIKKIRLKKYGECLICSDENYGIQLFNFKD